jgi:transcriptional regulator
MYNPSAFQVLDPITLRAAIRRLGVGELITSGPGGLDASIMPLLVDDDATRLTGHLARANEQWRRADPNVPVLVTWRGPDAYVSPSYYPSKVEHGKVVPTWNYITIQARGTLTIHDDPVWVRDVVSSLTDVHEAALTAPWAISDAPPDYIDAMLRAIVGIEVQITSLDGKWKLSQNRPTRDVVGVIDGLASREARPANIGEAMRQAANIESS